MILAILDPTPDPRDSLLCEDVIRAMTQRRRDRSMSRAQVARILGHETPAAVVAWETGKRYPRIDAWLAWCRALDWGAYDCLRAADKRRAAFAHRGRP